MFFRPLLLFAALYGSTGLCSAFLFYYKSRHHYADIGKMVPENQEKIMTGFAAEHDFYETVL